MITISTLGDPQAMGLPVIERIYPKASELSEILNYNPCPECAEVFHNTPNLEMHLAKYHRRESRLNLVPVRETNVTRQFYCPEQGCKYSGGFKFFTQHKYLKQHYIKVHMEKKFLCEQCGKGFTTVQHRKRHLEECGMKFTCSCGAEYNTIAALLTHASRKQHTFVKSWTAARNRKNEKRDSTMLPKQSLILPKPRQYDTIVANTAEALSELSCQKGVDIGVQTEPAESGGQRRRRNTSRQTQTGEKRTRISSETQTVGEYCNKNKKNNNRRRKKSMETQTKVLEHTVVSEDSCYSNKKDVGLPQLWFNSATETQTQTPTETIFENPFVDLGKNLFDEEPKRPEEGDNFFTNLSSDSTDQFLSEFIKNEMIDEGKSCSIETQTEFSFESLFDNYANTLTNIETQTSHDMWDQYNNTCTQTCDDILLAFSDIETQTAWLDVPTECLDTHGE